MHKLIECDKFYATLYRNDKVHLVRVCGFGLDGLGRFFKVERSKEFVSAKECLDFLYYNSSIDTPSLYDFDYYSHKLTLIDYLNCGVDFDED